MTTTFLKVLNRAISNLDGGIDDAVTSLDVSAGEGSKFPSTYPFHITIDGEILSCTNRSVDTLTVVRAQQGTGAASHSDGALVALNITAKHLQDIYDAFNTHEDDIDAHMADLWQKMRTGEYYPTQHNMGNGTTFGMASLRQYAIPIFIPRLLTVDRIAIYVSSAGAASTIARLGIYNDGTNLYPGSLLVDGGTVPVDSTGLKAATISQQTTKGLYWLSWVSDGTPEIRAAYIGIGVLGLSSNWQGYNCWWQKDIAGTTFADPFPAGGTKAETDYQPLAGLRVASLD